MNKMASVRTLGSRPHILRELAYTLVLSAIALASTGWMAAGERAGPTPSQVSAVYHP
jgi:hypothetical protein